MNGNASWNPSGEGASGGSYHIDHYITEKRLNHPFVQIYPGGVDEDQEGNWFTIW